MKLNTTFLRSKVGRRMLLLFVSCALVPTIGLATLSYIHVSKQLAERSEERLRRSIEWTSSTIIERLAIVEDELQVIAQNVSRFSRNARDPFTGSFLEHLRQPFHALMIVSRSGVPVPVLGEVEAWDVPTPEDLRYLSSGRPLLSVDGDGPGETRILMTLSIDPADPARGVVVGEIDNRYLWGDNRIGAPSHLTGVCVLNEAGQVVFNSHPDPTRLVEAVMAQRDPKSPGSIEWRDDPEAYLASSTGVFLRSKFGTGDWIVVMSEPRGNALSLAANLKGTISFVILLTLVLVVLLSVVQIKRNLVPLEELRRGTERVSAGDFEARVAVSSHDEFEELAESFNKMAARLARQFKVLTTVAEIDRVILSALDKRKIIEPILREIPTVFPCDAIGMALPDKEGPGDVRMHVRLSGTADERQEENVSLSQADIEILRSHTEGFTVRVDEEPPKFLLPLVDRGIRSFWVLPILLQKRLAGIFALGNREAYTYSADELVPARQLIDQVAVAVTNARLLWEVDQLNVGTLTALARAIDAKSPWTAGHSERVTSMALKIGGLMDLDTRQLSIIHRGGLLHDIGKIATPQEILDKPGELTAEEMEIVRDHVLHGARILEPIPAFKDIMPIVLQHHERYDGRGYPQGLAGEQIHIGARIFAVADCYDAISSDRPYRAAMDMEKVLEIIREGSGLAFDPEVVEVFFAVLDEENRYQTIATPARAGLATPADEPAQV